MTMDSDALVKLHSSLFEAATGERSFVDIVDGLSDTFGAVDGVIFELNRRTGMISNWVSPTLRLATDSYNEHINSINPRMHFSMAHAPGHVAYEGRFISEKEIRRNEFYDWLKREHDMQYFLGSRLYDEGDISVFHSLEFSGSAGHPEDLDIEAFKTTSRALANAWKLAGRRGRPSGTDSQWAPNHLPYAIFALDARGGVVEVNEAASQILEKNDPLISEGRALIPTHRPSRPMFDAALGRALFGERTEVLLPAPSVQDQAVLQFVPVAQLRRMGPSDVAVVVYVWVPKGDVADRTAAMQRLWGLTPPETKLVAGLAQGATLEEMADDIGIAKNTARNHLQNVFAKLGVNRQSELVRRVQVLLSGTK